MSPSSWWRAALVIFALSPAALAAQLVELERIANPDPSLVFDFGASLALSGDRLAIGAPSHNSETNHPGAVYVFERSPGGGWSQAAFLQASDGFGADAFGGPLALSGDRLLTSAPSPGSDCEDCPPDPPVVYFFERDALGAWNEVQRIENVVCADVALDGDLALVGGRLDDLSEGVRVFERGAGGAWTQTGALTPDDAIGSQDFGLTISLSGERLLVGAYGHDALATEAGSAYVFERQTNGTWLQVAQLFASEPAIRDYFGGAVSLDGERALVGARGPGPRIGSAYVFERQSDGSWVEVAKLSGSGVQFYDSFGINVSLLGERALVAATGDDHAGVNAGAVYVFERQPSGAWLEVAKLTGSAARQNQWFGAALLQEGDVGYVGAIGGGVPGSNSGNTYAFDFSPLDGDVAELSAAAGGTLSLELDGGHLHANEPYFLFGSLSGTSPGIPLGFGNVLPLQPDAYLFHTLFHPNRPPLLGSAGELDAAGRASARFRLPRGVALDLVGLTAHHAFVTLRVGAPSDELSSIAFVSNALPVAIVP